MKGLGRPEHPVEGTDRSCPGQGECRPAGVGTDGPRRKRASDQPTPVNYTNVIHRGDIVPVEGPDARPCRMAPDVVSVLTRPPLQPT
jgi:hypothetical protein